MVDPPVVTSAPDVQSQLPSVEISLSRVGVTGVEKVIRIRQNGSEQLFHARLECFVDLGPEQKGAHMSRFEEVVNDAIGEVILGEATFRAETLAEHVAQLVRERQSARRAEVTLSARFPEHKPAPESGITTQEMSTLYGSAGASQRGQRRIGGVVAEFPDLADAAYVSARQENLETIHQHNVVAERFGTLGEVRREIATGEHGAHHTALRAWLDGEA